MERINQLKEKFAHFYEKDTTQDLISVTPYLKEANEWINEVSKYSNDIKLSEAWKCIGQGNDIEKSINQLYNYVNDADRAFFVSDSFRKIILCNSRLASSIIAYIMGEIIAESREFKHSDALLYNALYQMTDYDVRNFKYIMENTVGRFSEDDKIIDETKIIENKESINLTIQVCLASGLLGVESTVEYDDGLISGDFKVVTSVAERLLEYINKVNALLEYGL